MQYTMNLWTLLKTCAAFTLLAPLLPQVSTAAASGGQNHASVMKNHSTNACETAGGTCTKDPQCNNQALQHKCPADAPYCCLSSAIPPSMEREGSEGQQNLKNTDTESEAVTEEEESKRDNKQHRRKQNGDRWGDNSCSPNKRKCMEVGGVCTPRRQCTTMVVSGKCGKSTTCECCLTARAVATAAPSPTSLPSDVQQLLVSLTGTLLDLLSLQNSITNTLVTIVNSIVSVVAPDVDLGAGRVSVSTDVNNLQATAEKLAKTMVSRNTGNIKAIITELENRRLSLMNHDPQGITRADVINLSHTAKLLVAIMRILPDMYDAALTKAVSAKMQQGRFVRALFPADP